VGRFIKGDVVVLPFPFTNLAKSKKRPAFVVKDLPGDDLIVCQITSGHYNDNFSISLSSLDFINGKLNHLSYVRPNRIFTAEESIIYYKVGRVNSTKIFEIISQLIKIITN